MSIRRGAYSTLRPFSYYSARFYSSEGGRRESDLTRRLTDVRDSVKLYFRLSSSALKERASNISSTASTSFQDVGGKLNRITGYDEIEALKLRVMNTEAEMNSSRQSQKDAKTAFETAVARRAACQKQVNDLLQRKSFWTDGDVQAFTSLVRQDHINERTEATAKVLLATREADVERQFNELLRAILNRYHEEQVWSDKIRSASTYGSLIVLGVNIAVFVLAIVIVEPYKRKRLAQTFEKRIEEISRENKDTIKVAMKSVLDRMEAHDALTLDTPRHSPDLAIPSADVRTTSSEFLEPQPMLKVLQEQANVIAAFAGGSIVTLLLISLGPQ